MTLIKNANIDSCHVPPDQSSIHEVVFRRRWLEIRYTHLAQTFTIPADVQNILVACVPKCQGHFKVTVAT